ncbi:hypothetical protein ABI59_07955 [Acidobacteria bacterium Mor1]|nr:hypothetical protein ABI59_07955 [Acidobacteria bacterium Mor1]
METLVVVVVVSVLLAFMQGAGANRVPVGRDGRLVIAFGRRWRLLCRLLLIVPMLGLAALLYWSPPDNRSDWVIIALTFLFFGGLGAPLVYMARITVALNPDGIERRAPLRRPRQIRWPDIETVQFSRTLQMFSIRSQDDESIWVYCQMDGIRDMIAAMEGKVVGKGLRGGAPRESVKAAKAAYGAFRSGSS